MTQKLGKTPDPSPKTIAVAGRSKADAKAQMERNKARVEASEAAPTVFESRNPEASMFDVAGYRPIRNFTNGRLEWVVPAHDLERFKEHHHVVTGRLVLKPQTT